MSEIIPLHEYDFAALRAELIAHAEEAGGTLDYADLVSHAAALGWSRPSIHDAMHTLCKNEFVTFEEKVVLAMEGDQ